jgi:hypothetical protein
MVVKYCNAVCQKNRWLKHKQVCEQRSAEIQDKALVKDPSGQGRLPDMIPTNASIFLSFIRFHLRQYHLCRFADEQVLANRDTGLYYSCCGTKLKQGVTTPVFHLES